MADAKLVFFRPPDGTGRLVFGDTGEAAAAPEATIGIDADLPGLDGAILLRTGPVLGLDADLPGLDGTVELLWDANVSRGGMRHELQARWQEAAHIAAGLQARWQEVAPLRAAAQARWQEARRTSHGVRAHWQETERLRSAVAAAWQVGERLRHAVAQHWQESHRLRAAMATGWQEGQHARCAVVFAWQELERLRAGHVTSWQQQGVPVRRAVLGRWGDGLRIRKPLRAHWQEAMRPPAGVSVRPIDPPKPPPCYDPATLGRLIFTDPHSGDGRLVFVCQRGGTDPATIIVLPRRSYIVINAISLVRVSDGAVIPATAFGASLDADSWTWGWRASMHAAALPLLQRGPGGEPVDMLATINGTPLYLSAESWTRERSFGSASISVQGRGRAAILDVPYAPQLIHGNALGRTALQLMTDALTVNGVGIGWDLDWQIDDWLVPGGVWTHQGSHISAILDIAAACGGYVQPHDTEKTLRILPRYPDAPWRWGTHTPDFELPSAAISVEGVEWQQKVTYNRVHVLGAQSGVEGVITRAGTAGTALAPMVTHPLITHGDAARQRGLAVLSDTGHQARISLRMQVLPETGVIKPGALVRYVDGGTTHLGLVRATELAWQAPQLRQIITLETHPS